MGVSLQQSDKSLRYQNYPDFPLKKLEIRTGEWGGDPTICLSSTTENYIGIMLKPRNIEIEIGVLQKQRRALQSWASVLVVAQESKPSKFATRFSLILSPDFFSSWFSSFLFSWNYFSIRWFGPAPPRTHTESFIRERKTVWKYPKTHTPSSNSNSNLSYFFLPNLLLEINLPSNKTLVFFSSSYSINVAWHETKIRILEKPDFSFA